MYSVFEILCCSIFLLYPLTVWGIAGYAYRVNAQRAADDPQKKDFHPAAVFLSPITLPFFAIAAISLFILKAILYGIFLLSFTILLVFYRETPRPTWSEKLFLKIGNILLEANTRLIKLFLSPWTGNPQSI